MDTPQRKQISPLLLFKDQSPLPSSVWVDMGMSPICMKTPLRQPFCYAEEKENREPCMIEGDGENFAQSAAGIAAIAMPKENTGPVFPLPPTPELLAMTPQYEPPLINFFDDSRVDVLYNKDNKHANFEKKQDKMLECGIDVTCYAKLDIQPSTPKKSKTMSSVNAQALETSANCVQCKLRQAKTIFGVEKYTRWTNPGNIMLIDSLQLLHDFEVYERKFGKPNVPDLVCCEKHTCGVETRGLTEIGSICAEKGDNALLFNSNKIVFSHPEQPDGVEEKHGEEKRAREPVDTRALRRLMYEP